MRRKMKVPRGAAIVEKWDQTIPAGLLPEEAAALGAVSGKRRHDFSLGRQCAREALRLIGVEAGPILRGPSREPIWPDGVIGSITHCEGYCAAVVCRRTEFAGVGIDAEVRRPIAPETMKLIAGDAERSRLRRLDPAEPWDVLLFSAKESVFKTWFPIAGTWLGFEDAQIEFMPDTGRFRAVIREGAEVAKVAPREFVGDYTVGEKHVFTGVFIQKAG
jgi:4'-phosphopantetheinyl transferase EntD